MFAAQPLGARLWVEVGIQGQVGQLLLLLGQTYSPTKMISTSVIFKQVNSSHLNKTSTRKKRILLLTTQILKIYKVEGSSLVA